MVKKIAFIIIILVGLTLRLYQITEVPKGLFIDEIAMAVDAKTLVENGTDQYGRPYPFGFEDLTDYKLPGYLYPAALGYKIFGNQTVSIRLPAILASIASLFLLWYFTKTLFPSKKELPYYATVVLSLCYYQIQFGRIAYESMLATAFFILYLTALIKLFRGKQKTPWLIIGGGSLVVCMWTYPAVRFIIPVFTLSLTIICYITRPNGIKRKDILTTGTTFLLLSAATFIPSFLNKNLDKRPMSYLLIDMDGAWYEVIINKSFGMLTSWLRMFNLEYLFEVGDAFAYRHGTRETGLYPGVFLFPLLFGLWYFIKEFSKKSFAYIFLGLLLLVIGIPSALTSHTPYGPRILAIIIPLSILIALGFEQIVFYLSRQNRLLRRGVYLAFFAILIFQVGYFAHAYFIHYAVKSLPEFPGAPIRLGKIIASERKNHPENTIYFLNGESCRRWSHDDLHVWYFGDLPNRDMINWNNTFREVRYAAKGSPFDAYDNSLQPKFIFNNFVMNASYDEMDQAPKGSLMIRCGHRMSYMKDRKEKIEELIYMYPETEQDLYYIVSRRE